MDDRIKDRIEDAGLTLLEIAVAMVPYAGAPLAVITNKAFGSSYERRINKILGEMRDDLTRLEASGTVHFDESLTESDEYQAAISRVLRQLVESDSDEKRKLLRNALLNRLSGFPQAHRFERPLESCDPWDIQILNAASALTVGEDGSRRWVRLRHHLSDYFASQSLPMTEQSTARIQALVSLGLLHEDHKSEIRETRRRRQYPSEHPGVEQTVVTVREQSISTYGALFLQYLRDPLRPEGEPAEA